METLLKTPVGTFDAYCFDSGEFAPPVAFAIGSYKTNVPLVRLQSECLTGLVFDSLTCDCSGQRTDSMRMIADRGTGIIIHLWQEGRGIGLADKMRAYAKQINDGADTVDANLLIGRQVDERTYDEVPPILEYLGVAEIDLLTNNPSKMAELEKLGVRVRSQIPIPPRLNDLNRKYIEVKARRLKHTYNLESLQA
ncbi:GTP cyclohydrolase II [Mycobacteroides abscessus]|uniref:GTP cyclohydrolase II n=1 Tax=Mycobacteroides abscessus TaxID=36809 RepID=UPI0034DD8A09